MSPLWSSRPFGVALGFALVGLGGVGFLPLFGGPSYEAALAAGLWLPGLAAIAAAVDARSAGGVPPAAYGRGLAIGASMALAGAATLALHGARVGFCDAQAGFVHFAAGPGAGAIAGGAWGAFVGVMLGPSQRAGGRVLASLLALGAPIAGIAISVWRFYTSPMIFAFDPFIGFFAGTLYDTVITGGDRLLTYRVGTLQSLGVGAVICQLLYRDGAGRLRIHAVGARPGLLVLGIALGAGSVLHTLQGPALGHYQTTETIQRALGHSATAERCVVLFPTGIKKRDAHALARDCDAHVAALEAYFETRGPERITVYVFANDQHKGALMGAARVYIAKPWRHEIYIQGAEYPHPVLGHELAHVIAGSFGVGPFRVAGPAGGLIPDPGRIEGVAVAASPRADDDLSLLEWAKAMKDLELLPPITRIFKLSFLGESSSKAYTVAGAFLHWLKETHGVAAVKAWYGGAPIAEVTDGKGLAELETEFTAALDAVKVGAPAMDVARARFDRPAIFGRRCPHVVDQTAAHASSLLSQLDTERARIEYGRVLALDPHDFGARYALGTCALREGKLDDARASFAALAADERLSRVARNRAREELADLDLVTGKVAEAIATYAALSRQEAREHRARGLVIKGLASDETTRAALIELLIGTPERGADWTLAVEALSAWSVTAPKDGLPDYLLGKNYYHRGYWEEAALRLDRALERRVAPVSALREALRVRLFAACALGQKARAREVLARFEKTAGASTMRKRELRETAERCGAVEQPRDGASPG